MSGGRCQWRSVCVVSLLVFVACDGRRADARAPDEAVFELGGDAHPLAEVLRAVEQGSPATPRVAKPPLVIPATPKPLRFRTVKLGAGQTLTALCGKELGDASRWREVAELNGWSEDELRRLSTGTEVRIPIDR